MRIRLPFLMSNKSIPMFLALAFLLATGCARRYQITLTNGNTITTQNKPKLNPETGAYLFKDAGGKPSALPRFRVKEIEPL
jgi:hypothetical protein